MATKKKTTKAKNRKKVASKKPARKKTVSKKTTKKKPAKKKPAKKKPAKKKPAKKKPAKKKPAKKKPVTRKTTGKKPVSTKTPRKKVTRKASTAGKAAKPMVIRRPAATSEFEQALKIGRPPNVVKLFPNSRALIVSGKFIDRALMIKGNSITIATNARNHFIIRGALCAAQRAKAAILIEIARSEGGANAYCAINYWNLARLVDSICNELNITVPVAIHADHYGLKKSKDVAFAKKEIPSLFEQGITSIAIDASHMPDDENLLANLELNPLIPDWAGLETEVGEIKGTQGLSTVPEALFLIQGLNAHGIFPDWIALNNGTAHGIQTADQGIQVDLTADIHDALTPYRISGAQHGTSGNDSNRLREIATRTRTTKANVATALQMVSWGLEVNDFGNAQLDDQGQFIKVPGEGMAEEMWNELLAAARTRQLSGGSIKQLNLPFEPKLQGQPRHIRERMAKRVEDFVYTMLVNVLNGQDTAQLAIEEILRAGSHDPGPKSERLENPAEWTREKIIARATELDGDKGPEGDFDD